MNQQPDSELAVKTYRYLRISMVGIVLLLGVSVILERAKVACWQTSISAYYYTPVRAIFVAGLFAIGVGLIVIKGSTRWEDVFLNFAGMLAPVVAVVPTSDAGDCWSLSPSPLPKGSDGKLADWVLANINNNVRSLLFAGFVGLIVAGLIASIAKRDPLAVAKVGAVDMRMGLVAAFVLLLAGLALHTWWDAFPTRAHGFAAVLMFVFLALATASNAKEHKGVGGNRKFFRIYGLIAVLMAAAGVLGLVFLRGWSHMVLFLEIVEILLFAAFWLTQTNEHWYETA